MIVFVLGLVIIVVIVSNVFLWNYEMNQLDWERMQEDMGIVDVTRLGGPWSYNPSGYTLDGTSLVSGDVSDLTSDDEVYMIFKSYYSGTDTTDFVDKTSDIDTNPDIGSHSNFTAQQYGPDNIFDVLTEASTAGSANATLVPNGDITTQWSTTGMSHYTEIDEGIASQDGDTTRIYTTTNNAIDKFDLTTVSSIQTCTAIDVKLHCKDVVWPPLYWGRIDVILRKADDTQIVSTVQVDPPNGVYGTVTASWTDLSLNQSDVDGLRLEIQHVPRLGMFGGVHVTAIDVIITYSTVGNYKLDLEIQWTSVDYDETNEELCIYAGNMGSEDLLVDYWIGSTWNLLTDLTADSWNNVSVPLTGTTFTIRFKGGNEIGDATPDSWNIDVTLLHVWSDEYIAEVEFTGSSNTEDWNQLNWTVGSAWTVGSVSLTIQLYDYTLDDYPTSGDGYMAYTSDGAPNTDETKSQAITTNPTRFRNATGHWKMRIRGVKATDTQFNFKADWIELEVQGGGGTCFTFENEGSITSHLVSLWITNSTQHKHYDINLIINSGQTITYTRLDICLPSGEYVVKVVTERGNMATYPGS